MKQIVSLTIGLTVYLALACPAQARNVKYLLPIKAALESTDAREKPDGLLSFSSASNRRRRS